MGYQTDIWHVGIAHAPIATFLTSNALANTKITWLPALRPFQFIADPFGLQKDGKLYIFVEHYDYRTKHGTIHCYVYDEHFSLKEHGQVMRLPFHLSYPVVFEHEGAIYLLPEAHRSRKLTMYKATAFPFQWEPYQLVLDLPVIDASPIFYNDYWWLFYSLPGSHQAAVRRLYIAYAETLDGPWLQHTMNPVQEDIRCSRPGGRPFIHDGMLYLTTQDCSETYGGALSLMAMHITPHSFYGKQVTKLDPPKEGLYPDGIHTLSGCGDLTLFDVKRIDRSSKRRMVNLQRKIRRLLPV